MSGFCWLPFIQLVSCPTLSIIPRIISFLLRFVPKGFRIQVEIEHACLPQAFDFNVIARDSRMKWSTDNDKKSILPRLCNGQNRLWKCQLKLQRSPLSQHINLHKYKTWSDLRCMRLQHMRPWNSQELRFRASDASEARGTYMKGNFLSRVRGHFSMRAAASTLELQSGSYDASPYMRKKTSQKRISCGRNYAIWCRCSETNTQRTRQHSLPPSLQI